MLSAILFSTIGIPVISAAQDVKLIEGAKKEGSLMWYTSTSKFVRRF
jgi:hypothetical protein